MVHAKEMPKKPQRASSDGCSSQASAVTSPGRNSAGIELYPHPGGSKTCLKVELDTSSLDCLAVDPAGDGGVGMNPALSPLCLALPFPACGAFPELIQLTEL